MSGVNPPSPIEPRQELARRDAVARLRQRISVTGRVFTAAGERATILVNGEQYEVDLARLRALRHGHSPEELGLVPINPDLD